MQSVTGRLVENKVLFYEYFGGLLDFFVVAWIKAFLQVVEAVWLFPQFRRRASLNKTLALMISIESI